MLPVTVAARVLPPMLRLTVAPASFVPLITVVCSLALTVSSVATVLIVGAVGAVRSVALTLVPGPVLPAASVALAL